jgi:hypothetical protein
VLVKGAETTLPAPLYGPEVMRMFLPTNYIKISKSHLRRGNTKRGKIVTDKTVNGRKGKIERGRKVEKQVKCSLYRAPKGENRTYINNSKEERERIS